MADNTFSLTGGGTWSWSNSGGSAIFTGAGAASVKSVTISGLSTSLTNASLEAIHVTFGNDGGGSITFDNSEVFATGDNVTIGTTGNNFTLSLASSINTSKKLDESSFSVSSISGGNATIAGALSAYYQYDDNNTSIIYHKATNKEVLATISGLSTAASVGGNISLNSAGQIFLMKEALGTDDIKLTKNISRTLTSSVSKDSLPFKLSLANSLWGSAASLGFDNISSEWSMAGASATGITAYYTHGTDQGWSLTGDTITYTSKNIESMFTIDNLFGAGISKAKDLSSGISLGSGANDKIVTIDHSVIGLNSSKDVQLTGNGYSLKLHDVYDGDPNDDKDGFITSLPSYWSTGGTSAYYKHDTGAGWSLNTATNTIHYTPLQTDTYAKIFGLSGVGTSSSIGSVEGISLTTAADSITTFTLSQNVFDTSKSSTVSLVAGDTYKLALASSLATAASLNATPGINLSVASGNASITGKVNDYYSFGGNSTTITYHPSVNKATLVNISGLSTGASTSNISLSGTTITLLDGAFGRKNISLAAVDSIQGISSYKFSIAATSVATKSDVINDKVLSTISISSGIATISGTTKEYYTLGGSSQSVEYHEATTKNLASISGLNSIASSDYVKLGSTSATAPAAKYINLSQSALGSSNVKLTYGEGIDTSLGFKLQLVDTSDSIVSSLGFQNSSNFWSISGGTATYQFYTNEGWKRSNDTLIAHTDKSSLKPILTISNLSNSLTATGEDDAAKISGVSIGSASSGGGSIIYLSKSVLSRDTDKAIELENREFIGSNKFQLALDTLEDSLDGSIDGKVGFERTDPKWSIGSGEAIYSYTQAEGWELKDGEIKYTAAKDSVVLAKITGLKTNVTSNDLNTTGVVASLSGGGSYKGTINIQEAWLADGQNVSLEVINGNGGEYSLSLSGSGNGKFGFAGEGVDSVATWSVSNDNTAYYTHTTGKGWSLAGDSKSITYADASTVTLMSIKGLDIKDKKNLKDIVNETAHDDNKFEGTVVLAQSLLGSQDVSISLIGGGASYKLKLSDGTTDSLKTLGFVGNGDETTPSLNVWNVTGSVGTYTHTTGEGWSLTGSGDSIVYAGASTVKLATIYGLKNNFGKSGLAGAVTPNLATSALFDGEISLNANMLGDSNISLNSSGGADYKLTFGSIESGTARTELGFEGRGDLLVQDSNNAWSISGTSAVYKNTTKKGWILAGNSAIFKPEKVTDIITITGLNATVKSNALDNVIAEGSDSIYDGNIILTEGLLGDDNISIISANQGLTSNYKLQFASIGSNSDSITTSSSLGFLKGDDYWSITSAGTSAILQFKTNKGWSLSADSLSATFTQDTITAVASITGIKSGLTVDQLKNQMGVGSTISLTSAVLNQTDENTVKLHNVGNSNYSLTISSDISTVSSASMTTALDFTSTNATATAIEIKNTRTGGWLKGEGADSLSYTYHKDVDDVLANVSGLRAGSISAGNIELTNNDENDPKTIIAIKTNALGKNDITVQNTTLNSANNAYTLKLADDDLDGRDNKVGFQHAGFSWAPNSSINATAATWYSYTDEGWSLSADATTIKYTSKEGTYKDIVKVSGLSAGFSTNALTVDEDEKVIAIGASALSTTQISVDKNEYRLAFTDDTNDNYSLSSDGTKYGFDKNTPTWEVKDGKATYSYTTNQGWTIDNDGKITNTPESTTVILTISGLSAGTKQGALYNIIGIDSDTDGKLITLKKNLLADGEVKLDIKAADNEGISDYKLIFDSSETPSEDGKKLGFDEDDNDDHWTIESGSAKYLRDVGKGWTLADDGLSIAFSKATNRTLASISNINIVAKVEKDSDQKDTIEGITVVNNNTIGVEAGVLSKDSSKPNVLTSGEGEAYTLALYSDPETDAGEELGFAQYGSETETETDIGPDYWKYDGSNLVLNHNIGQGWTLAENTITYSPEETKKLAQLSGIKSGLTEAQLNDDNDRVFEVSGNKITVKKDALADKEVRVGTLIEPSEGNYVLALDEDVPTIKTPTDVLRYSNGTATFLNIKPTYYEAQGDVILYSAEVTNETYAKITEGLADNLIVKETTNSSNNTKEYKLYTIEKDADGNFKKNSNGEFVQGELAAEINENNKKIKLWDGALNKKAVKLDSDDYKIELQAVVSPQFTDKVWTVAKTALTFKATSIGGYTTAADGKSVSYTAGKDTVTLFTISGLNANGIKAIQSESGSPQITGVFYDENSNTVTLDKSFVGTTAIKISSTDSSANYKLNISGIDVYGLGSLSNKSKPDEQNIWTLSGTTAVYKKVIPAYYALEGDTIKYYAEKAVPISSAKNAKATTYATIKGLASGLVVSKAGDTAPSGSTHTDPYKAGEALGTYNADGKFVEGITFSSLGTTDGTITLAKEVLGTTKVTLTDGNSGKYTLAFDKTTNPGVQYTPQRSNYTWEVSKNTSAVLKADISAGYTIAAKGKSIAYAAPKVGSTLLTVTGLKSGIEVANTTGYNFDTSGDQKTNNLIGMYASGGLKNIQLTAPTYDYYGKVKDQGIITLPDEVLGTTNIAFKGTDYKFANVDNSPGDDIEIRDANAGTPETIDKWRVSGTTAKFTRYIPAYYSYNANMNTVTYHKEAVYKNGKTEVNLATLTNLPKGLVVGKGTVTDNSNPSNVIDTDNKLGIYSADGKTFTPYVELDGSTIKVYDAALNKKNIALTSSEYSIDFFNDPGYAPKSESKVWSFSGTTATLKIATSEGYVIDGKTIKYSAASKGTVVLTISGLVKGLKASKAGDKSPDDNTTYKAGAALGTYDADGKFVAAVSLDASDQNKVNLTKDAFGTTAVTFATKKGYGDYYTWNAGKLLTDSNGNGIAPDTNQNIWTFNNGTATLKQGTSAGFAFATDKKGVENSNKLVYSKASANTVLTTIKGLAKGLKVDAFGNIDGITLSGNTIKLTDSALTKTSKVTSSNSSYTFDINDVSQEAKQGDASVWYVTKGPSSTSIIEYGTNGKTAGYAVENNTVVYKNAEKASNPALTITGLKSGLKTKEDGTVDGITLGTLDNNGNFTPNDSTNTNGKTVQLSKSVLGTKAISITKGGGGTNGYSLNLDKGSVSISKPEYKWYISGTTATYKQAIPKGYYLDNGVVKYASKATTGNTLITIKGLKKGLKLNASGKIDGITLGTLNTNNEFTPNDSTDSKYIKIATSVLGTSNIILTGNGYKFVEGTGWNDYGIKAVEGKQWTISGTVATYRDSTTTNITTTKGYKLEDNKITYTAAKAGKALATVKGLVSGLVVDTQASSTPNTDDPTSKIYLKTDTDKTNALITLNNGEIQIKEAALGNTVSVSGKYNTTTDYTIAVDQSATSSGGTLDYNKDTGVATYEVTTPNVYEEDNKTNTKKLTLKTAGGKTTVTINGLADNLEVSNDKITKSDGITEVLTLNSNDKVFTVKSADAIASGKTLSINGGDYKLALDLAVNSNFTRDIKHSWKVENGTATYIEQLPADAYYCDGTSISKIEGSTQSKILTTISGLPTDITSIEEASGESGVYKYKKTDGTVGNLFTVNDTNRTFTLEKAALTTNPKTQMKVIGSYTFAIAEEGTGSDAKTVVNTVEGAKVQNWFLNGTTATYKDGTDKLYKISDDKKTITYTDAKYSNTPLAILTGFNKSELTSESLNAGIKYSSLLGSSSLAGFALADSLLGSSEIKFSTASNSGKNKYNISLQSGNTYGGNDWNNVWTIKSSDVYYTNGKEAAWSVSFDDKVISYTAASLNTDSGYNFKLSGLNTSILTAASVGGSYTGIDFSGSNVSINGALFFGSNDISLQSGSSSDKYILGFTGEVDTLAQKSTSISITSDIAQVVSIESAYYKVENNNSTLPVAKYHNASVSALASITGLNKNLAEDDIVFNEGDTTITLNAGALGTDPISIAGSTSYSLALGSDVILTESITTDNIFAISGTTATLKEFKPVSYSLSGGNRTVEVDKGTGANGKDIAKITNLKKGLSVTEGEVEGISINSISSDLSEILLDSNAVSTSTIKLSLASGHENDYVLAIDSALEPEVSGASWTNTSSTATYKGKLSAGFMLSTDGKTLTYSKASNSSELAKISGLKSNNSFTADDVDDDSKEITVSGLKLNNTVTLDGKNRYSFNVDADYNKGTINGTSNSDTIRVEGFGVTVNGNAGDDFIDLLGEGEVTVGDSITVEVGNVYNYTSGHDVIENFSKLDSIKASNRDLTKATIQAFNYSKDDDTAENDLKITFDPNNSIVLKDYIDTTAVQNSINNIIFGGIEYRLTGNAESGSLTAIPTTSGSNNYAVENYNFSLTPNLGEQSNVIIYGGKDKK